MIAPLDWGMGHTTRSVPLIQHVLGLGHHVVFAGNAGQRRVIEELFQSRVQTVHLDGYNVTYSSANRFAQAGILSQLPRIAATIKHEHDWLQKQAAELQIDGIISDNRYGLFHRRIPSVIITHQLRVMTGMGSLADKAMQRLHYQYLNRFSATWVADVAESPGLAGELSHSRNMPKQYAYIGLLSRFHSARVSPPSPLERVGERSLILLSGPEPQRTNLSRMLWQQAVSYNGEVIFAEGSDHAEMPSHIPSHITYHRRLNGSALEDALRCADVVVCRSGYSTLMDLAAMSKRAVLIPTPGQTEQEYLAKHHKKRGAWYSAPHKDFDLNAGIAAALSGTFAPPSIPGAFELHKPVLDEWLAKL
ncbi:MAG: glycosyl transferase family 28 [Taibaiella sp.]|nr:glycosyl transferase family 28 [Taibaiella sp.]